MPCATCPVRDLAICREFVDFTPEGETAPRPKFESDDARANIYHEGEFAEHAVILCTGWAFRFVILPDGGRQILDFVLPGDVMPTALPFRRYVNSGAKALTDVSYRRVDRQELEAFLFAVPQAMQRHTQNCIAEIDRVEAALSDLGRRTATERVARLMLSLMARLERRGFVRDNAFDFPLRQQHIADALGLTQVHVNRILRSLREAGLISVATGRLEVHDVAGLHRLAGVGA